MGQWGASQRIFFSAAIGIWGKNLNEKIKLITQVARDRDEL
jgi:hypothetical protein